MEAGSLRVSPEAVYMAAEEIEHIATTVAAARGPLLDAVDSCATRLYGWRLAAGLGHLNEAWSADLRAYDRNLYTAADALNQAAVGYRDTDRASSDRQRR